MKSNWRESVIHGAAHGVFMTLPPYIRIREGEGHELGFGVRNGSHTARSRSLSETSESVERVCEATSAEGTARCASRGMIRFASAGIIAVLFGPGNGGTMNIDAMHDGITNPAPVSDYECDRCNTHVSSYPDDDGGYLRIFIGQYMRHPLGIS